MHGFPFTNVILEEEILLLPKDVSAIGNNERAREADTLWREGANLGQFGLVSRTSGSAKAYDDGHRVI